MKPTPEQLSQFAAVIKAAMGSSDQELDLTAPDGTPLHVVKNPESGIELRVESSTGGSSGFIMNGWDPADERPVSYPTDLPFVPGVKVSTTVTENEGRSFKQVQWMGVADADAVLRDVVEQSIAAGWQRAPATDTPRPPFGQQVEFTRDEMTRLVVAASAPGAGFVMLLDK